MIKAVIFDLDGVLVKSDHYHTAAWSEICKRWGIAFNESVADLLRGISRIDSAKIVVECAGASLSDDMLHRFAEEKNQIYINLLKEMTKGDILPGAEELTFRTFETSCDLKARYVRYHAYRSTMRGFLFLDEVVVN